MKNLNSKELAFWNALINDWNIRLDKSFLSIMFLTTLENQDNLIKNFREVFEGFYEPLLENSDLLFYSVDGCFVGKYKNTYWGTGSEGELNSIGHRLYNLPYVLISNATDVEDEEKVINYYNSVYQINYNEYKKQYKEFCLSFGYVYEESFDFVLKGREDFDQDLKNLI